MADPRDDLYDGEVIDTAVEISERQLCRRCAIEAEWVRRLVDEGILEPVRRTETTLYFPGGSVHRIRTVMRLHDDLGVNLAGAALVLDLLDRIERLKRDRRSR